MVSAQRNRRRLHRPDAPPHPSGRDAGLVKAAFIGRLTRTSLLEVFGKDYVRTARAKGAGETRVVYRHALRNALLPLTTGLGLSLLATLSGSVAIELVFNRRGIGRLLIDAIAERDYASSRAE